MLLDLLKSINEFDEKRDKLTDEVLVNHVHLLEGVHQKIHTLLVNTRMNKLLTDFGDRPTDIYVISYPRSGTTLMQMILHQMTTNGKVEFNHIYEVSPWLRALALSNQQLPIFTGRRIVKSHDEYAIFKDKRKGKFVFVIRDGLDVIPSICRLYKDYINPFTELNQIFHHNVKNWFRYNSEWIENKSELAILYLNFEDIVENKSQVILQLSEFLEINVDKEMIGRVLERSSFSFMKEHESKFGEQPIGWKVYNNFIRNGQIGTGKAAFTESQLKEYYSLSKQFHLGNSCLKRYF